MNIIHNLDLINIEDNIYYKECPKNFLKLKKLVEENANNYSYKLVHQHKDLLQWITKCLPQLTNTTYKLSTKIYWILYGLVDFPICEVCHEKHNYIGKNVITVFNGYRSTCSRKCSNNNPIALNKKKITSLKKYGCEIPQQLDLVKQKQQQTMISKYGVKNSSQSKEIKQKIQKTCIAKYGVASVLQSDKIKAKIKHTNKIKYGAENPFSAASIKDKIKQTNKLKYGVENPSQSEYIKHKKEQTYISKYGVRNPMQCNDIRKKSAQEYTYNSIHFSSAPEIAFYIWLVDNKITFEYQPNIKFEYVYEGKLHYYIPDFKVEEQIIEIKGDHFLKNDGTWQCPFNHQFDGQIEAKRQCLIRNNVKILYSNDYQKYIDYVKEKYGKNYLKQFKNSF